MARKVVNRKELRAQADAAEARGKTKAASKEKATKEKKVKEPKKPGEKKTVRKKVAKEARMKAYWGVFTSGMKRLALFEYADKKAAEKKVQELIASSRNHHFLQLVKEPISE
jgi:hypothetical protein